LCGYSPKRAIFNFFWISSYTIIFYYKNGEKLKQKYTFCCIYNIYNILWVKTGLKMCFYSKTFFFHRRIKSKRVITILVQNKLCISFIVFVWYTTKLHFWKCHCCMFCYYSCFTYRMEKDLKQNLLLPYYSNIKLKLLFTLRIIEN